MSPDPKSDNEHSAAKWLGLLFAVIVILCGTAYLVAIPFGRVGENRYQLPEALMFGVILFIAVIMATGFERIAISSSGLELDVRRVQARQARQQDEIESLRFLVSYFVTDTELDHLKRLASGRPAPYENDNWYMNILRGELRRLRSLGLIDNNRGRTVQDMPFKGDLADHAHITDRGKTYLKLRSQVEQPNMELTAET